MATDSNNQQNDDRAIAKRREARMYAARPTAMTRFIRVFLPWQMFRFAMINLKMIGVIIRSH